MFKYIINILILINLTAISHSQDTINFRLYDSLKTSAEDNHNHGGRLRLGITSSDPDNLDVRLFRTINNARSPFKDEFFDILDRSTLPVSILFPLSLFTYSRIKNKTFDENSAYLLVTAEAANLALTFGAKLFIKRKRPVNALPNCYSLGGSKLDMFSFPSGHTSMSFAIATIFTLRYPKYPQIYAPMYVYALLVAYGRPYFGRHYPSDLLGGAIIGAGSSVLIYSFRKELFKLKNNVLSEEKSDNGSINGGVLSFFAGSFIASAILNTTIFRQKDKVTLSVLPSGTDGFGMNLNWKF